MKKLETAVLLALLTGGVALVAWRLLQGSRPDTSAVGVSGKSAVKAGKTIDPAEQARLFRDEVAFHPVSGSPGQGQEKRNVIEESDVAADSSAGQTENNTDRARDLLNSGVSTVEKEALRALILSGKKEALAAALGKMLTISTDNPDYKDYRAIFADCKDPAVAAWLADFMGRTDRADVRDRIRSILTEIRSAEVILALVERMKNPQDDLHGQDCAEAVADCKDPSQVQALKSLLEQQKNETLRKAAALALANVGNAEACGILIEKASAADAAAQYSREALASVTSTFGQEALISAAVNPDVPSGVRIAAVQALSKQDSARVLAALENLKSGAEDVAVRSEAEKALAQAAGSKDAQVSSSKTAPDGALVETCF